VSVGVGIGNGIGIGLPDDAGATAKPAPLALEAIGLSKRFGTVLALDNVSLQLERGSVHALLGENGAGKSTLVKCVMGYYPADAGRVLVGGLEARIDSPRDAAALGVGMVYQHFTLVDNMTVAENLVLARRQHPFIFDWAAEVKDVAAFMARMPFRLDPAKPVRMLAAGEKQKLEILKQLYLGSSIVILDEPTSVLTPSEADEVLGLLRGMAKDGRLTILMISHKFREVMAFADEVTVLRRGRLAGRGRVADLTPDAMARMMVGDEPPRATQTRQTLRGGAAQATVLEIADLSADDDLGTPAVANFSLRVREGEIVGIAGVSGNGQEELVEVLAGQREARAGRIEVNGARYQARRAEMRDLKVRCLPDEPLRNACVGAMSVAENIGFRRYDRHPFTRAGTLVSGRALRRNAEALIVEYGIRTPGPDAPIGSLSGGNVQRAVLARELSEDVAVLVASNPCFGLDFAAVAEIRSRLMEARNRGAAVLLISADLDEIFALADRIVVISEGRAVHETPIGQADLGIIGRHMAGHA
jgi:simple sugar transport system ATP-binding protein